MVISGLPDGGQTCPTVLSLLRLIVSVGRFSHTALPNGLLWQPVSTLGIRPGLFKSKCFLVFWVWGQNIWSDSPRVKAYNVAGSAYRVLFERYIPAILTSVPTLECFLAFLTSESILDKVLIRIRPSTVQFTMSLSTLGFYCGSLCILSGINVFLPLSCFSVHVAAGSSCPFQWTR